MANCFRFLLVLLFMILALSFATDAAQRLVIFENQTSTG